MDLRKEIGCAPNNAAGSKEPASRETVTLEIPPTHKSKVCAGHHLPPGATERLVPTFGRSAWTGHETQPRILAAVVEMVEQAQRQIHHSRAILMFLKSVDQGRPSLLQYLHEADRTFLQALEYYQSRNFDEAHECASACCELCNLIEILVSRAFQSASQLANAAENDPPAPLSFKAIHADIERIDGLIGRIEWVAANGTLPVEDREQVQKLALWSESLHRCSTRLLNIGAADEATELLRAAEAAAVAAEHVCRKSYGRRTCASPRNPMLE